MNPTDPMTPVRALIEAAGKADAAPWFTVDAIWLPGPDVPTYVVSGFSDPHIGKPVVDAFLKDEFEEGESEEDAVSQADANMEFCAAARNATASISQLLSEHDKVVEYIKELRASGLYVAQGIANRLAAIVEGK